MKTPIRPQSKPLNNLPNPEQKTSDIQFDYNAEPIWELAARLSAQVPQEEWAKLPTDLARNFDHYQQQDNSWEPFLQIQVIGSHSLIPKTIYTRSPLIYLKFCIYFHIITSEVVLTEVLNDFSKRGQYFRDLATNLIRDLRTNSNVTIITQTTEQFDQALQLYQQRKDKAWSHTDCVSFNIMTEYEIIEALAYDKHFEQAGFITLMRN